MAEIYLETRPIPGIARPEEPEQQAAMVQNERAPAAPSPRDPQELQEAVGRLLDEIPLPVLPPLAEQDRA